MTPARIQWAVQKTSITTDRAEAVGSFCWTGRKKSDRRTSERRRGGRVSRQLVNSSVKDEGERETGHKYEDK